MRFVEAGKALLLRAAWLVLAALVAFGGAGIVAAMDHVPGTPARPELTWAADQLVRPALDAATDRLDLLAGDVAALGTTAREALANVNSRDIEALEATLATGDAQLRAIDARTAELRADIDAVPALGPGAELRVSRALRARHGFLAETPAITEPLAAAWAAFDARALTAARLASLLDRHDQQTGAAVLAGSEGRYADALAELETSAAIVAELRSLIAELSSSMDVAQVTDWVDRNAAYDAALETLYAAVIEAEGRSTRAVTLALEAERAARARLPEDNRALIVIMSDVAQGGINQAVVRIEDARGRLEGALLVQRELAAGVEPPG